MPKHHAEDWDPAEVRHFLSGYPELKHLRVRKHGALLILESGSTRDPIPHARFRRVTVQYWRLEMPTHTGKWQPTPIRAPLSDVLETLVTTFPWTLQSLE